eukprot:121700-Chlamydomonas_euryale.AAC.1
MSSGWDAAHDTDADPGRIDNASPPPVCHVSRSAHIPPPKAYPSPQRTHAPHASVPPPTMRRLVAQASSCARRRISTPCSRILRTRRVGGGGGGRTSA